MDSQPSQNRRDLPRYRFNLEVVVYNEAEDREMGKLVDLNQQGMMVIAREFIPADCLYQIRLDPTCPDQLIPPIALGVDCIWSHRREQQVGCWAGFQIIDASDEAVRQMRALIDLFGES